MTEQENEQVTEQVRCRAGLLSVGLVRSSCLAMSCDALASCLAVLGRLSESLISLISL